MYMTYMIGLTTDKIKHPHIEINKTLNNRDLFLSLVGCKPESFVMTVQHQSSLRINLPSIAK